MGEEWQNLWNPNNGYGYQPQGATPLFDTSNNFEVQTPIQNQLSVAPNTNLSTAGSGWFNREALFGQGGWATPALQGVGTIANTWLGLEGLSTARDQLNFQKNAWQQQFALQKEEYDYQRASRKAASENYDRYRAEKANKV